MSNLRTLSVPAHLLQVLDDNVSINARVDADPTDEDFGDEGIAEIRVSDAPVLVIDLAHAKDLHDALGALLTGIEALRTGPATPAPLLHAVPTPSRRLTPTL